MAISSELKNLSLEDLARRADELRQTLFQDQLKLRTGTLEKPNERTTHKRELAQVLTVLTQKKREAAPAASDKKA
jgi:large subunit ribosomal protein L29